MSNSAKFPASVELPKDKNKHTASQQAAIIQKFLGSVNRDITKTGNPSALEDAAAEVLEKRRDELKKQLKMESQVKKSSKEILKKHKKIPRPSSTSSDSSSSSDSGSSSGRKNSSSDDSSTSSSSSSRESRKMLKGGKRRRTSSSSSNDHPPLKKKLTGRKHGSHKKSVVKIHAKKVSSKGRSSRALTPISVGRKRSISPQSKGSQKALPKQKSVGKEKHHSGLVKERSRDTKDRELHREKEKMRHHGKERVRSRSPVKSRRSPQRSREPKRKSHEKRLSPSKMRTALRRDRSPERAAKVPLKDASRRHESSIMLKERERRDKERADREAARNKERAEALARCQERQRERERLAKEKELADRDKGDRSKIVDRLLPRPAERAMALAASRGEGHDKVERDRTRSHSRSNVRGGEFAERRYHDSPTLRRDREERHGERGREHEYVLMRNRPDARGSLTYDSSRRGGRDEHEVYGEVPMEPRYETHEDRHLTHDYTSSRAQYGSERIHREHEWERGMEQGRERMYDRTAGQSEWERSDMTMARGNDLYTESGEWKVTERQWDENGSGKPAGNWQGGLKDDSWEAGYQERDTWMDRHREVNDGGRRWQPRRSGHPIMSTGDGDARPEPYRRAGMPHAHAPHVSHMQGEHMNSMPGNTSGVYHHNQGMRHIQPQLSGSSDMSVPMGVKEYGNQSSYPASTVMAQTPQKRPMMTGMSDSSAPPQDLTARKAVKTPNTSEEVIEDDLSEISDDADEILNSVENASKQKDDGVAEVEGVDDKKQSEGVKTSLEAVDEVKDEMGEKSMKDMQDDFNLGFEEISDGELEEEARVKGLGDALGVDWTSLVTESRARDQANRSEATSMRQKWKHHQVLLNLGISVRLAGEEFTRELLKRARQSAREDKQMKNGEVVAEHEAVEKEEEIAMPHRVADVQVAQRKATERRARLISQTSGCFSRALNARRDLQVRRQLCGFPIQEVHYCSVSPELNNLAVQLFKKATSLTM
ncbi:fl(2)d-associated complex component isoform X2 [Phlebotomus argentipes]|uniref:fl(2)d-associated complex component isoform X2 n=1 Tax=Phlebotomus argentipes TaxID=94469 RepID=UPI0028933668|nr:fl(2)d-associated complex component isoform X2 [Phlebotomus argentipes]